MRARFNPRTRNIEKWSAVQRDIERCREIRRDTDTERYREL